MKSIYSQKKTLQTGSLGKKNTGRGVEIVAAGSSRLCVLKESEVPLSVRESAPIRRREAEERRDL